MTEKTTFSKRFGEAKTYYTKDGKYDDKRSMAAHELHYSNIVKALGYDAVKRCVPFELKSDTKWKKDIIKSRDRHLNNLPLKDWDRAATCYFNKSLLDNQGVNAWSLSQIVCLLKECARMMLFDYYETIIPNEEIINQMNKYIKLGWTDDEARIETMHNLIKKYRKD